MVLEISTCKSIHSVELLFTNHHHLPPLHLNPNLQRYAHSHSPLIVSWHCMWPQPPLCTHQTPPTLSCHRPLHIPSNLINWCGNYYKLALLSELETLPEEQRYSYCVYHITSLSVVCVVHWKEVATSSLSVVWVELAAVEQTISDAVYNLFMETSDYSFHNITCKMHI